MDVFAGKVNTKFLNQEPLSPLYFWSECALLSAVLKKTKWMLGLQSIFKHVLLQSASFCILSNTCFQ